MRICPLSLPTIESVVQLEKECFAHPWSYDSIEEYFNNPSAAFFVAKDETDNVVGYIGSYQIVDEVYITNIAVTTISRRQGVGKALLNYVVDYSKKNGASFITLEVRQSNMAAISLYQSADFIIEGTRQNFYRDPKENALIMTRHFERKEGSFS